MRPELVDAVAANVAGQLDVDVDLIFVPNHSDFREIDLESRFRDVADVSLISVDPGTSLGAALNRAMASTSSRFVAKFDDDDHYGPHHLVDSLRAHGYAGAGVVGKHTYYASLQSSGERLLRFPGNEFRYSSTLAGGTLVIDREQTGDLGFRDISLGEDRAFVTACHRRGTSTFAADRFNFVQSRRNDNTWAITDADFAVGTTRSPRPILPTWSTDDVLVRPIPPHGRVTSAAQGCQLGTEVRRSSSRASTSGSASLSSSGVDTRARSLSIRGPAGPDGRPCTDHRHTHRRRAGCVDRCARRSVLLALLGCGGGRVRGGGSQGSIGIGPGDRVGDSRGRRIRSQPVHTPTVRSKPHAGRGRLPACSAVGPSRAGDLPGAEKRGRLSDGRWSGITARTTRPRTRLRRGDGFSRDPR